MKNFNLNNLRTAVNNSPEVAAAYLFGSAAKKEPVVNDIDVLVLLYPNIDKNNLYFELIQRITQTTKINVNEVDILYFDLKDVDPEILYDAINNGIQLKNESPKLLSDKIEELSTYFMENEFLILENKRLRSERLEEFCGN